MLATGVRLGSALALDVGDVDLDHGELRIRTAKRGREHRTFLPAGIRELLRDHVGDRTGGALFLAQGDQRIGRRQAQRRLAMWAELPGLRGSVSPHRLRHTFATDLYGRTGDVLLVKEALGHRSIASTIVYARCDERRVRAAMGPDPESVTPGRLTSVYSRNSRMKLNPVTHPRTRIRVSIRHPSPRLSSSRA